MRNITQRSGEKKHEIQERQYAYPYHYIPSWKDDAFSQVRYWTWGYRYLGGMKVVLDQLTGIPFKSLLDVGCGDGRFLREVAKLYPDVRLLGVDTSERAIKLARAMNPQIHYEILDIVEKPLLDRFDVVTAIEVLEHIPPSNVAIFLETIANSLKDNGRLILTVPHVNVDVQDKHYQHFTSSDIRKLLDPHFQEIVFIPFDVQSRMMGLLQRLVGGRGDHFVVTNRLIMSLFFQLYIDKYLYAEDEHKCMRIAAVSRK